MASSILNHTEMAKMDNFLVIGYGNTLRRDDGVGREVAETVAQMNLPRVTVIARHQLVPELAAPLSEADAVIFVDADSSADAETALRPVEPAFGGRILAHATDPRTLLALSKQLFGRSPKAWTLAVHVEDFGFGVGLSPRAQEGLRQAVDLIRELAANVSGGTPANSLLPEGRKPKCSVPSGGGTGTHLSASVDNDCPVIGNIRRAKSNRGNKLYQDPNGIEQKLI